MIQNFPFLLKQTLSADEKRVLDTLEPQIKIVIDNLPELSLFKDRCIDDNKEGHRPLPVMRRRQC
jgi:hypothetical protein